MHRFAVFLVVAVGEDASYLTRRSTDRVLSMHSSYLDGQFDRGVVAIKSDEPVR